MAPSSEITKPDSMESLDQQICCASHRVDIARNNMRILQHKIQRRLHILSERLSSVDAEIDETLNPEASLLATKNRIESHMEKVQLTWGQRINMAESGVEYEIMALQKLVREKHTLEMTNAQAREFEVPKPKATAKGCRWSNGPL